MRAYASGCTSLTSLAVPDTSSLTSVGDSFMAYYASGCSSLTELVLPAVGWFEDNNVNWSVPADRLGVLKGRVLDSSDLSGWKALTVSGKTLYTNYIRDSKLVIADQVYSADALRQAIADQVYSADALRQAIADQVYSADALRQAIADQVYSADALRQAIKEYEFIADTLRHVITPKWTRIEHDASIWSKDIAQAASAWTKLTK